MNISVVMTTYDNGSSRRTKLAIWTLNALLEKLTTGGDVLYVIADDGSPPEHVNALVNVVKHLPHAVTNSYRAGVGKSKNIALQRAFDYSPIVLMLEDDWVLKEPLDISRHIRVLQDHKHLGIIRMGYLGGEMLAKHCDIEPFYPVWHLQQGSGVYVYSGQVSLRHKRFYDATGYHAEGVTAGVEEEEFCHRYNGTPDAPIIVWPTDWASSMNSSPFINIGLGDSLNAVEPG